MLKLSDIAARLECELTGDPDLLIYGVSTLENAGPGDISFLSNPRYIRAVPQSAAAAIIAADAAQIPPGRNVLVHANPYWTFSRALALFHPPTPFPAGIHPTATIDPAARIGANVSVGAYTWIGPGAEIGDNTVILSHCAVYPGAVIGRNSLLHSHCVIREACRIGDQVVLQNNVIIGGDGFGFAKDNEGAWAKIPQTGIVIIEDDVEIGAGTTIDRATLGETRVEKNTKIDNLTHIGHGCVIGQRTLLCAQVGLAGSTQVGNNVILAGQVGSGGHLTIGDGVLATAQAGIPSSVPAGKIIAGSPAIDKRDWLKTSAVFDKLPQMFRDLNNMKRRLLQLEAQAANPDSAPDKPLKPNTDQAV
ncbi:MAG: UDP-3-O-(3-hydroxymyristoyl)glucosamine N-acyltransferase [Blastocatellia bacterium]